MSLALVAWKYGDLKLPIALNQPALIVVYRLAGSRQPAGGDIVVGENLTRIRLAALQGYPDRDLIDGRAGQSRICEALRSKDHMHAKAAALPNDPVEQQRSLFLDPIFLREELLEFIDDQNRPRHPGIGFALAIFADAFRSVSLLKQFRAGRHFLVERAQDADAEFTLALNRDDPGMGQGRICVILEFDTLLEVDQIEFDLVGRIAVGHHRNEHVQQVALATARAPDDQRIVRQFGIERDRQRLFGADRTKRSGYPVTGGLAPPVIANLRETEQPVERDFDLHRFDRIRTETIN